VLAAGHRECAANIKDRMANDPLFYLYKRARNKLRRYNPQSVLGHGIDILHKVEGADVEVLRRYQPWNILLALKWALQEADELSYRRSSATLTDFHRVLNILHDMEASVRMPSSYEHVNCSCATWRFSNSGFNAAPVRKH
jgi:hypothetical protein